MRKIILLCLAFTPFFVFGQLGVSFHQSSMPFVGVNYELKNRFRSELRVGADNFIISTSLEAVVTYDILEKEDFEFYAGLGVRAGFFEGVVIPIGFNFYPFSKKTFGFHIELTPIAVFNPYLDPDVLRGSCGIRYRFLKE